MLLRSSMDMLVSDVCTANYAHAEGAEQSTPALDTFSGPAIRLASTTEHSRTVASSAPSLRSTSAFLTPPHLPRLARASSGRSGTCAAPLQAAEAKAQAVDSRTNGLSLATACGGWDHPLPWLGTPIHRQGSQGTESPLDLVLILMHRRVLWTLVLMIMPRCSASYTCSSAHITRISHEREGASGLCCLSLL